MSGVGALVRVIIIIPVIALLILWQRVLWPIVDAVFIATDSSAAVHSQWGNAPTTAVSVLSVAIPLIGLGLFLWHWVAPTQNDIYQGRRF